MSEISHKTGAIVEHLRTSLAGTGWDTALQTFLVSQDFRSIVERLIALVEEDKQRFTPGVKQLFRPFHLTPWQDVRVVVINAFPYARLGVADGLALSAGNPSTLAPLELSLLLQQVQKYCPGTPALHDLSRWAQQGVLLLNASLTTQLDRRVSHKHADLWRPFLMQVLDNLQHTKPDALFLFIGEPCWYLEDFMRPSVYYEIAESPVTEYHAETLAMTLQLFNEKLQARGEQIISW